MPRTNRIGRRPTPTDDSRRHGSTHTVGTPSTELLDRGTKAEGVSALRRVMLGSSGGFRGPGYGAVANLQAIGDPEAVSALIEGLQASDPDVAGRAAQALGQLGASEAVPALVAELERRGDDMARHERDAFQLAVVGLIKQLQTVGGERAFTVLVGLLDASDLLVSRRAARAVAELKAIEAIPALVRVLELRGNELPVNAQLTFIRALREMPHASSIGVLTEALYRKGVQEKATLGLMELRMPEATAALESAAAKLGWWKARRIRRALRSDEAQHLG